MILAGHGLISMIVHPDYIMNKKSNNTYRRLLAHLAYLREKLFVWATIPREINNWWRIRSQLNLVPEGKGWRIEGEGNERARVAYAHLVDGRLKYSFEGSLPSHDLRHDDVTANFGKPQGNNGLPNSSQSVTTGLSKIP
jgi:hypothetical protein